jgi:alpha-aminoadipic semialdehyde synthase
MRKSLVVGVLKEEKNAWERRTSLAPSDVKWLVKKGIKVEVESSPVRVFKDESYRKAGAKVVNKFNKATLLVGIKELDPEEVKRDRVYMIFSHTMKGQLHNRALLKKFVNSKSTLIDYEKITDTHGRRLVYFGRYAGICGLVDSLSYLGRKLKWKGINNPFIYLKPSRECRSLEELKKDLGKIGALIHRKGFDDRISPFIVGITGHGNVSKGVQEVLGLLSPEEIHPRDMNRFIKHQRHTHKQIYKIVFLREEKLRAKNGEGFYFEEYLDHPGRFESNLDKYLPHLNVLIHTSYWDKRYPRMATKEMVKKLYRRKDFRLEFIGDISCDINGSIELTRKVGSPEEAIYTYDPKKGNYIDGHEAEGITVFSVDNLPSELPKESSEDFSRLIREYVYQVAVHGAKDVTNHAAIPREIRKAVISQGGRLMENYKYLGKYL